MMASIKRAGIMSFAFIGCGAICGGLVAIGLSNPVWFWGLGIVSGYAIICAGTLCDD
jgi:hypothetical protein